MIIHISGVSESLENYFVDINRKIWEVAKVGKTVMKMKKKIELIQIFESAFDFERKIETKLCLDTIHLYPHYETKVYLCLIQSCQKCFLQNRYTVWINLIDPKCILGKYFRCTV